MRRYWIDKNNIKESKVLIDGDAFKHICDVCRMDKGSKFELITEEGRAYFVELIEKSKKGATAEIIEFREIPSLPLPHIHLAISLPKFSKMDLIIEKCVELGVYKIHPFVSDFSFVKKKSIVSENKLKRWQKIVVSATQQCGRGELMSISEVKSFEEILKEFNQSPSAQGLFMYEGEAQLSLKSATHAIKNGSEFNQIWAFIGSEGGFSDREVEVMKAERFQTITLGDQVLRVETACVALASILKYEFLLSEKLQ